MSDYFDTRYSFDKGRTKVWKAIAGYLQKYVPENGDVLELGCGYADFINSIRAQVKYATDINYKSGEYCSSGVRFFQCDLTMDFGIGDKKFDVIFASNLLEHFSDEQLKCIMENVEKHLKNGGKLILLQPNYKYCYKDYFDDFTHIKVFSHTSLSDFLIFYGYHILKCIPRFLPFSFKSRAPKSYLLTKIYINLPLRPMAKQMLVIAEKHE